MALPQIRCQLHDHASNMTMMERVIIMGRWNVAWQYISEWYRRKLGGTREDSNGGRVRVHITHGLNISHKELTYLLQKCISYRNKELRACS